MAKEITTKKGIKITLRNPFEKGKRFAQQLKNGKIEETGKELTEKEKAYRIGYLNSRGDNAKAYNHKNGLPGKFKKRIFHKKKK